MTGPATDDEQRHRRLRTLVVVGVVLVGVFAVALGAFVYLYSRRDARPVGLDDARRRFLEDRVADPGPDGPYTPPEGVYAYRGTGSESLSTPPKSQTEGPEIPGTVTHGAGGCWSFRLDYSTNHYRIWDLCADDTGLQETGGTVFQRWDFVVSTIDTLERTRCAPPAVVISPTMEPGDRWDSRCEGENSAIAGTTVTEAVHRFVGWDRVRVGGETVDAMHLRDRAVISDAQTGTEAFDLWITIDGLIVRGRQRIVVDSDSPIGKVTYTQEGEFSLVRATPEGAGARRMGVTPPCHGGEMRWISTPAARACGIWAPPCTGIAADIQSPGPQSVENFGGLPLPLHRESVVEPCDCRGGVNGG